MILWFIFALLFIIVGLTIVIRGQVKSGYLQKEFTGATACIIGFILILIGIAIPIVLYSML